MDLEQIKKSYTEKRLLKSLDFVESRWEVVELVCKNPCWQRLWIMQEVLLPDTIVFWYETWTHIDAELRKVMHLYMIISGNERVCCEMTSTRGKHVNILPNYTATMFIYIGS